MIKGIADPSYVHASLFSLNLFSVAIYQNVSKCSVAKADLFGGVPVKYPREVAIIIFWMTASFVTLWMNYMPAQFWPWENEKRISLVWRKKSSAWQPFPLPCMQRQHNIRKPLFQCSSSQSTCHQIAQLPFPCDLPFQPHTATHRSLLSSVGFGIIRLHCVHVHCWSWVLHCVHFTLEISTVESFHKRTIFLYGNELFAAHNVDFGSIDLKWIMECYNGGWDVLVFFSHNPMSCYTPAFLKEWFTSVVHMASQGAHMKLC